MEKNIQGINYKSIENDLIVFHGGGKITNSSNVDRDGYYNVNKIEAKGSASPVINAIDIDWNGAQVEEDKVINTTSELLKWIQDSLLTKEQLKNINELINLLNVLKNYFNMQEPTGEEPTGEEPEYIDNGDGPYYWYIGNTQPTENTDPKTTKGWTSLNSKPNQIVVFGEDPNWDDVQWYIAAPAEWGFDTTFNGARVGGWSYSTTQINGMEYAVWTCRVLIDSVNVILANI